MTMANDAVRQRFKMGTTGKAPGNDVGKPSSRFMGGGGYVRTQNSAHTTHGAPRGYSHRVGKSK